MNLLIVTQAVDTKHSVLGFFPAWVEAFSKHFEHIEVICLFEGEHTLPSNVSVHSLGKKHAHKNTGVVARVRYTARFLRLIWNFRSSYDVVFVHMNPEYVVLAGPLWRLLGKPVGLWYVHKHVGLRLRVATLFANRIFTASAKSFRFKTRKRTIVGHGIDTDKFRPAHTYERGPVRIISVGRIAPAKRLDVLVDALRTLKQNGILFSARVVGGAGTSEDETYRQKLEEQTNLLASFEAPVLHEEVPALLATADVFVNLSETGSIDKAVLEAMASGVVPVTANEAFEEMLGPLGLYVSRTPAAVATVLGELAGNPERRLALSSSVRSLVVREHSLPRLAGLIRSWYEAGLASTRMPYTQLLRLSAMRLFSDIFRRRSFRRLEAMIDHADPELRLLPALVAPGTCFVDVGSNIGIYTYAAKTRIDNVRILACEPQPHLASRLSILFPNITLEAVALSSHSGVAALKVPIIFGKKYTSRATLASFVERGEKGEYRMHIPTDTLDAVVARNEDALISCIKIDVEGHEREVLEGARSTLTTHHPALIVEIEQRHHDEPIESVFTFVQELGYEGYFFDSGENGYVPIHRFSTVTHQALDNFKTPAYVNNFVFLKAGSEAPTIPS